MVKPYLALLDKAVTEFGKLIKLTVVEMFTKYGWLFSQVS